MTNDPICGCGHELSDHTEYWDDETEEYVYGDCSECDCEGFYDESSVD